jgi:hypothetical protein
MHGVRDAAGLFPRAMHMLKTQFFDIAEPIFPCGDAAGHDDHAVLLSFSFRVVVMH